jgi:hypothetical protein
VNVRGAVGAVIHPVGSGHRVCLTLYLVGEIGKPCGNQNTVLLPSTLYVLTISDNDPPFFQVITKKSCTGMSKSKKYVFLANSEQIISPKFFCIKLYLTSFLPDLFKPFQKMVLFNIFKVAPA